MSVSTSPEVRYEGHRYRPGNGLLRPFYGFETDTGDATGGTMIFNFELNGGASSKYAPWVVVNRVCFTATAADPGAFHVDQLNTDWERADNSGASLVIAPAGESVPHGGGTVVQWAGGIEGSYFLGRMLPGTLGRIRVKFDNVNLAVVNVSVTGYTTEDPLLAMEQIRA